MEKSRAGKTVLRFYRLPLEGKALSRVIHRSPQGGSLDCRETLNVVKQRGLMEILPPSDEGGGQRKALVGGREKQYYFRYLRIVRILSFSLPQSALLIAP